MNDEERQEIRALASLFTSLGSRVIWDGDIVRSIAIFGSEVQDKHLSDLRRFPGLREVNLTRSKVTDAGMFYLGKLVDLELLMLGGTKITDEGFEQLQRLTRLTYLNLIGTGLTDAGLQYFRGAVQMEALWLERTDVTDAGMETLKSFPLLKLLDVGNTFISDAALAQIGQLAGLEELVISACPDVRGTGFSELSKLKMLTDLWIDNCTVGDDILPHIQHLPLRILSLNWTDITDVGLAAIATIDTLKEVHLIGSRVSCGAAEAFKKAKPNCVVHFSASRAG